MIIDSFSGSLSTGFLYTRQIPKCIFDCYKYNLGMNDISIHTDKFINVTLVTTTIEPHINDIEHDINLTYGALSSLCKDKLINTKQQLVNISLESTNNDTSESGTFSYQKLLNMPCSAVLSNPNYYSTNLTGNLLKNDMEYKVWVQDKTDEFAESHMRLTYGLETEYNSEEYAAFNINEDPVVENGSYITSKINDEYEFGNTCIISSTQTNNIKLSKGCAGILLSYTDENHKNSDMIPMAYYEFEKPIFPNNNVLKIEWNTNGILRLE